MLERIVFPKDCFGVVVWNDVAHSVEMYYVTGRQENSDSTAHSYPAEPTAEQSYTNNPMFQATKRQIVY